MISYFSESLAPTHPPPPPRAFSKTHSVTLRFENIEYSVELPKKKKKQLGPNAPKSKRILKGISGEVWEKGRLGFQDDGY